MRRFWWLLGLVGLGELLAAAVISAPDSVWMPAYRIAHLLQMLALIGVLLSVPVPRRHLRLMLAGLLLSFIGDVINSFLINLSAWLKPQILLSIPFFVLAHACYISQFVGWLRQPPAPSRPPSRKDWGILLCIWPLLALGMWWLVIDRNAPPLLLKLSLGYALVVMLMGSTALLLALRCGRAAWAPALGGLSFVISDCLLGSFLLDGAARPIWASQAIWVSYFLAQWLLSVGVSRWPRRATA